MGIDSLEIQRCRWKTGRIDLMALGGWGLGIGLVFFAPNIVADLKSRCYIDPVSAADQVQNEGEPLAVSMTRPAMLSG
ncbi:hypothetical protein [Paraburkholderia humisilvae]|uniref:Uncharacterized protein n=1 Tax=Paraburkholderia humisilvae TaxID=627669 RepID=A0A6J5F7H4_9BURK|nr:hypothetical protein [Paraburkholderia humisilvae]CAB3773562.1 hypothetical protein LMG29542_07316 [Paraburkholderia humisilvae]